MRGSRLLDRRGHFSQRSEGRRSRRALVALAAVAVAGTALADLGPLLTVEQLTDTSAAVVRGRVHSVDSGWDVPAATIYTYVAVDVDRVLRGEVPQKRIVVKELGGIVGDVALRMGGQPGFAPGEEVVLFLHVRPRDNTLQIANSWQGKWSIQTRPDGEVAVRHAGLDDLGAPVSYSELDLGLLESRVRGQRPEPRVVAGRDIVFDPAEAPEPVNTIDRPVQKIPFLGFSWRAAFAGSAIPINFHETRHPRAGRGKRQLVRSRKAWNSVNKVIPYMGKGKKIKTAAPGFAQRPGDASIMLQNDDPTDEIDNNSTALARGGAWAFTGPLLRGLGPAISGAIVVQDSAAAVAFMANRTCYETVIKHELGHASGLGHSNRAGSLMEPSLSQATCNAGKLLDRDDMKFHRKQYHEKFLTGVSGR